MVRMSAGFSTLLLLDFRGDYVKRETLSNLALEARHSHPLLSEGNHWLSCTTSIFWDTISQRICNHLSTPSTVPHHFLFVPLGLGGWLFVIPGSLFTRFLLYHLSFSCAFVETRAEVVQTCTDHGQAKSQQHSAGDKSSVCLHIGKPKFLLWQHLVQVTHRPQTR